MKATASRLSMILTCAVLLIAAALMSTSRLEYCGQPEALRPQSRTAARAEPDEPTLAPPQKVVFIHVEADKPDLQVSWAGN
jgi:hypothetical protein